MNNESSSPSGQFTRRHAIQLGAATAVAAWFPGAGIASAKAAEPSATPPAPTGPYTLPPLPYAYGALEPHIDKETMHFHHDKHHQAYVDNANKLLVGHPELAKYSPDEMLRHLDKAPEAIRVGLRNNVGGHVNHSLFWLMMSPKGGGAPTGAIAAEIDKRWGSFAEFQKQFNEAALKRFGSGWAWLIHKDGKLEIVSTANQDSPVEQGIVPLLGLDVWEHAYYLKYQNRRPEYVTSWWDLVNWDFVNSQWEKAKV